MYRLLAARGWGSTIVEAAFELAGIAYDIEPIDPEQPADIARLKSLNPLGQIPTLILPDGTAMTESAAIVLLAAEIGDGAALAPPPGDPLRPAFLRWLVYLVGALYPTFTYGDDPSRYVAGDAVKALRDATDAQRKALWQQVEAAAAGPWFLGQRRSAIDLYIWAMAHWRPGRDWFRRETPTLAAIADALDAEPALASVRQRNGWEPAA